MFLRLSLLRKAAAFCFTIVANNSNFRLNIAALVCSVVLRNKVCPPPSGEDLVQVAPVQRRGLPCRSLADNGFLTMIGWIGTIRSLAAESGLLWRLNGRSLFWRNKPLFSWCGRSVCARTDLTTQPQGGWFCLGAYTWRRTRMTRMSLCGFRRVAINH